MEETKLKYGGNSLHLGLNGNITYLPFEAKMSREYFIGGVTVFQVKVIFTSDTVRTDIINNIICIKFTKLLPDDDLTYTIKLSSKELGVENRSFTSDDGTWRLLVEDHNRWCAFHLDIQMDFVPGTSSFASLHSDSALTDIELRGGDGSVFMHKAALAASCPTLRKKLPNSSKETAETYIDVPGASRSTLEYFKNFVYLRTLPEHGLEQLLLLTSSFPMPDLEQQCAFKLVSSVTAQNVVDLLEFAVKHRLFTLLYAVLECFKRGAINVDDLRSGHLRRDLAAI